MDKKTRVVLWIALAEIAICVPFIVIKNIIDTGQWWGLFYLVWAIAIEFVIISLFRTDKKVKALGGKR